MLMMTLTRTLRTPQLRLAATTISSSCSMSTKANVTASSPRSEKEWQVCASLVVERPSLLTPPLTSLQSSMCQYLKSVEQESTFKSDHELRRHREADQRERVRRGEEVAVEETRTTEDDEQDWKNELEAFKPASRLTPFENEPKSHNRALHRPLYLLVKQKIAVDNTFVWNAPTAVWNGEEMLRQTAERALHNICSKQDESEEPRKSSGLKIRVLGNAPFSFYSYKFPSKLDLNVIGMKYFLFKAILNEGDFEPNEQEVCDFMWATRDDLSKKLARSTANAMLEMLHDELP